MLGLRKVIINREHALEYPKDYQTVFHMLSNSVAGRCASATFTGISIEDDGYVAWSILAMEYDGEGKRGPEANRIRTELNALRLNARTNGMLCNNSFKECVRRLTELKESCTDSAYIELFIKNIDHPDYESLKEIPKSTKCNSFENCFEKIAQKTSELNTKKIGKTDTSITPRNVKFTLPD